MMVALAGAERRRADRRPGARRRTRSRSRAASAASRCPRSAASCGSSTPSSATTSTPTSCARAIEAVAGIGDAEDDRLKAAYGGRRYADLVSGDDAEPTACSCGSAGGSRSDAGTSSLTSRASAFVVPAVICVTYPSSVAHSRRSWPSTRRRHARDAAADLLVLRRARRRGASATGPKVALDELGADDLGDLARAVTSAVPSGSPLRQSGVAARRGRCRRTRSSRRSTLGADPTRRPCPATGARPRSCRRWPASAGRRPAGRPRRRRPAPAGAAWRARPRRRRLGPGTAGARRRPPRDGERVEVDGDGGRVVGARRRALLGVASSVARALLGHDGSLRGRGLSVAAALGRRGRRRRRRRSSPSRCVAGRSSPPPPQPASRAAARTRAASSDRGIRRMVPSAPARPGHARRPQTPCQHPPRTSSPTSPRSSRAPTWGPRVWRHPAVARRFYGPAAAFALEACAGPRAGARRRLRLRHRRARAGPRRPRGDGARRLRGGLRRRAPHARGHDATVIHARFGDDELHDGSFDAIRFGRSLHHWTTSTPSPSAPRWCSPGAAWSWSTSSAPSASTARRRPGWRRVARAAGARPATPSPAASRTPTVVRRSGPRSGSEQRPEHRRGDVGGARGALRARRAGLVPVPVEGRGEARRATRPRRAWWRSWWRRSEAALIAAGTIPGVAFRASGTVR